MRLLLVSATILAGLLLSTTADAGPFGPGRSEGAPPTKKKPKANKKAKKPVEADELVVSDDAPKKKAKPAKRSKPVEADDELVVIEDAPAKKRVKPVEVDKPAVDDEELVVIEEPDPLDEPEEAPKKQVAVLDDEVDAPTTVTKTTKAAPHRTRFYFRAGGMKQSTKLGSPTFSLQTDLPVDTSSVGAGSGVETQENKIPVGAIIGVVLPVLDRKLSLETVLGIPTPTTFKATGKLATESLAPTFMGLPTGIEPLGSELGQVTFAPPIVTAVYRVATLGPVTPIAGAGLMLLMGRGGKITNPVLQEAGDPKLSIKPSPGLVVQGGLDIRLWKRVAARLDVKYVLGMKVNATIEDIAVTPKAIPTLGTLEVGDAVLSAKVAPLIIQAGVGVDF